MFLSLFCPVKGCGFLYRRKKVEHHYFSAQFDFVVSAGGIGSMSLTRKVPQTLEPNKQ